MNARHAELEAAVDGHVSRETLDSLEAFEREFLRWSAKINLIASSTAADLWNRHILDSAGILKLVPADARRFVDLGSGGGFPGVVLAILLKDRPGTQMTLIESNAKKAAFLRTALGVAHAKGVVEVARVEQSKARAAQFDVVTARALAPLPMLLELSEPWLCSGAVGLFHKGRDYEREVKDARDAWTLDLVKHPGTADAESVVLEIRHLARKPQAQA